MSLEISAMHYIFINDKDDKPFPVDNEADQDDEENKKNSQCYSDSKGNCWNYDKETTEKQSKEQN